MIKFTKIILNSLQFYDMPLICAIILGIYVLVYSYKLTMENIKNNIIISRIIL